MNRRARAVAVLLLGITFVVGGLAGMALEEALGIDWFEFLDEDYDGEERLLGGLDLSADQRDRIEEILDEQEDRLEAYWESRLPEIQGILEQSHTEIRAILTPQQRAVFDRRVGELQTRVLEEVRD